MDILSVICDSPTFSIFLSLSREIFHSLHIGVLIAVFKCNGIYNTRFVQLDAPAESSSRP